MRITILLVAVFAILTGGIGSWYFSDHESTKRLLIAKLEAISSAANAEDRAALQVQTDSFFTPDATITLNVAYSLLAIGNSNAQGLNYNHTKPQFDAFINKMIAKVKGYGMTLDFEELTMDPEDSNQFSAVISASGFGAGASMMMGVDAATRFIIKGNCNIKGHKSGDKINVSQMDCQLQVNQRADMNSGQFKENLKQLKGLQP